MLKVVCADKGRLTMNFLATNKPRLQIENMGKVQSVFCNGIIISKTSGVCLGFIVQGCLLFAVYIFVCGWFDASLFVFCREEFLISD
jgi:hypothetical protein